MRRIEGACAPVHLGGASIRCIGGREGRALSNSQGHERLDQARVVVLDVADPRTDRPGDHFIGRVGGQ